MTGIAVRPFLPSLRQTMGTATSTCEDGVSVEYNWRIVEIP